MQHSTRNQAGFTLIELAIVVMIVGILAAIAIPNYFKFAGRAKEALVKENMHVIHTGMEAYSVDNLGVYPTSADEAALENLMPNRTFPDNPFTNAVTPIVWDAAPGLPGEISISNLPGGGYDIQGHGQSAVLDVHIQSGD
jgi:prepilin-type N-terminal cleavage/methylation domain-containing protein